MAARKSNQLSNLGLVKMQQMYALLGLLVMGACQALAPNPVKTITVEVAPPTVNVAANNPTPEATPIVEPTSSAASTAVPTDVPEEVCIGSFHDFVFQIDEDGTGPVDRNESIQQPAPGWPWQVHTSLDFQPTAPKLKWYSIAAVREHAGETEIWLYSSLDDYIVYRPDQQSYQRVPHTSFDKNLVPIVGIRSGLLHVTESGDLWSQNIPKANIGLETFTLLSKFNEALGVCQTVTASEVEYDGYSYSASPSHSLRFFVLTDRQSNFWFFHRHFPAVRFQPQTGQVTEYPELANMGLAEYSPGPDGGIYILKVPADYYDWVLDFGQLVYFDPGSRALSTVPLPQERWPSSRRLHTDNRGNIWIGYHGFRSPKGEWISLNPLLQIYSDPFIMGRHRNWLIPKFGMESSDGRLWFNAWVTDGFGARGMAWFDPASGEGCWFSDYDAGRIAEDLSGRLWLVVGRQLYMRPLNP